MLQVLCCPQSSLESIRNVDLFEDVIQVGLHSVGTNAEPLSNLIIGGPHSDQGKYLNLP